MHFQSLVSMFLRWSVTLKNEIQLFIEVRSNCMCCFKKVDFPNFFKVNRNIFSFDIFASLAMWMQWCPSLIRFSACLLLNGNIQFLILDVPSLQMISRVIYRYSLNSPLTSGLWRLFIYSLFYHVNSIISSTFAVLLFFQQWEHSSIRDL